MQSVFRRVWLVVRPISTFAIAKPTVDGVEPVYVDRYDWSRQFFGRNSIYQRFAYQVGNGSMRSGLILL